MVGVLAIVVAVFLFSIIIWEIFAPPSKVLWDEDDQSWWL